MYRRNPDNILSSNKEESSQGNSMTTTSYDGRCTFVDKGLKSHVTHV